MFITQIKLLKKKFFIFKQIIKLKVEFELVHV